uniref:uncharacterized protein LOC122597906 n=1 Tax=Erigeron canadensis TaxID=72917 RepID=UPI001CB9CA93|nr:uncharacterized protein LOC122597906 [Erigeron canadensis]
MAQAARLNLRMQKELKLLITDPPPGASFPNLDLSSSVSLTAIDALIDGPEGTVYEKGVFKIKIQIPERYPFQPPIVTFSTPIYHPNIDTGGRICLDILNLPPKGAWQPSLNISTVLTSIGLLLSEPNPDDGLMCEASKEYKYNKQVFDQKARSMTEKYAKSDASPNHGGNQFVKDSVVTEDKAPEPVKSDMHECSLGLRKISGVGRKLSLEPSGSHTEENDSMGMNEGPLCNFGCQSQIQEPKRDSEDMSFEDVKSNFMTTVNSDHYQDNKTPAISSKKLCLSGKNLQHKVPVSTKNPDVADKNAIFMTLKCAKSNESPDHGGNQFLADSSTTEVKPLETVKTDMHEYAVGLKKIPGISRKLSLNASVSNTRESEIGMNDGLLNTINNRSQLQEPKQGLKGTTFLHQQLDQDKKGPAFSSKKLCLSGKKPQHEVLASTKRTNDTMPPGPQKRNMLPISDAKAHGDQKVQKLTGSRRKLSLSTSGSNTRESERKMNEAPLKTVSQSQIQQHKQDLKGTTIPQPQLDQDKKAPAFNSSKLRLSGKNLQQEVLDSTKRTNDTIPSGPQKENMLLISKATAHNDQEVHKESTEKSCFGNTKCKKLGLTGIKPSFGFLSLAQDKENNDKVHTVSGGNNMKKPQTNRSYKGKPGESGAISTGLKLSRKPLQSLEEKHNKNMNIRLDAETVNTGASKQHGERSDKDNLEGMCDSEGVIVLDSEDSEEEKTVKSSSRRLIGRKRLLGKC